MSVIATSPPYCNTGLKQDSIVAATTRWSLSLPPPSSNLTVIVTVASTLDRIPNRDLLHRKPSDDTATSPRHACHHLSCGLRLPNLRVSDNSKSTLKPITPHMVFIHLLTIIFSCEEVEFHPDHKIENCMSISLTVLPFFIFCVLTINLVKKCYVLSCWSRCKYHCSTHCASIILEIY